MDAPLLPEPFRLSIAYNGARAIRRDAQAGARTRRSGMAYSPSYAKAAQRTKRNSGGPAPRYAKAAQRILHNVPVVYDVFAARIRACVARPGLQKCGGVLAWEWSVAQ